MINFETFLATLSQEKLRIAYAELNDFYRNRTQDALPPLKSWEQKCAYLAARFPATFAANVEVLQRTKAIYEDPISNLLDLGAGPGTAFFAAKEVFPELKEGDLIERDADFIKIGKQIGPQANWQQQDLKNFAISQSYDLIIASYALGELTFDEQLKLLTKIWPYANKLIILIEPGTPKGFAAIRNMRAHLLSLGGFAIAPCPHSLACPMPENDWCHFSVRLDRSRSHRLAKEASLSYEDEKFSYIAIAKERQNDPEPRILRHPMRHPGHIKFTLCTSEGIQQRTVSKKQGEYYKRCKKLEWGDPFEPSPGR